MNRSLQVLVGVLAAVIAAGCVALLGWLRVREARAFAQPHRVRTYTGTNYIARLLETSVGGASSGAVVIVYLRIENPNDFELTLDRNWFILVDHDKDYFLPGTNGTQSPLIKVPPHGVSEREMLSFSVMTDSFDGTLGLQLGYNYWALLKGEEPFLERLRDGHFHIFKTRHW
jgi:hypothetical protein